MKKLQITQLLNVDLYPTCRVSALSQMDLPEWLLSAQVPQGWCNCRIVARDFLLLCVHACMCVMNVHTHVCESGSLLGH